MEYDNKNIGGSRCQKRKYAVVRRSFPTIYRYPKSGREYFVVDCRSKKWGFNHRKNFNQRTDAEKYAQEIWGQILERGENASDNLIYQSKDIARLDSKLRPLGKSLADAVDFYVRYLHEEAKKVLIPSINELCLKWYESKRDSKSNPLRPKTKNELKMYWAFITRKLGKLKPAEVTPALAAKLIDDVYSGETNQTRKHYLKYVRMFFKWCVENEYILKNPTDKIRVKLNPDEIKIYTPEEIERLLRLCEEKFPRLLGFYCLTIFGGLRPSEAQRAEWKDIDFENKQIFVSKLGKRGSRRFVLDASDSLWMWLQHIKNKKPEQPLNPVKNHWNLQRKSREAFGEWIQDGLRHSFGTYYYNLTRDIFDVVYVMGNSEKIAKKHYLREVSKVCTEKFWALKPSG